MNFSFKFAKHVLQKELTTEKSENQVLSPLSISAVLNTLAIGSKDQLLQQLLDLLEFANIDELNASALASASVLEQSDRVGAPVISMANVVFIDQQLALNPIFCKKAKDIHDTEAKSIDFNQVARVVSDANSWANEKTKGLIKSILSEEDLTPETRLILANALYFKGSWVWEFNKLKTRDMDFHLLNGGKVRAPFMYEWGGTFDYGTFEGCQVIKMPYKWKLLFHGEGRKENVFYVHFPPRRE